MVNPVPGYSVSTAYKKTGSYWTACGFHTGQDYAAPKGTDVVAARYGIVHSVSYGSAFGPNQFVIRPGDGTEDFYAHTLSRPGDGLEVHAGQVVADVGNLGNATGFHLHFERHQGYGWSCSIFDDPMKSHNDNLESDDDMTPEQQATMDEIRWIVGQIKPQTDQINPRMLKPVDDTAWTVANTILDKLDQILQKLG